MNEKDLQNVADKKKAEQDERDEANKTFDEEAAKIDKRIKVQADRKEKSTPLTTYLKNKRSR